MTIAYGLGNKAQVVMQKHAGVSRPSALQSLGAGTLGELLLAPSHLQTPACLHQDLHTRPANAIHSVQSPSGLF